MKKIDSLQKKGLVKQVSKLSENIFEDARKNKNTEQIIKSLIYIFKNGNHFKEYSLSSTCTKLDSLAKVSSFPESAIMHMMLADYYWAYYKRNRWKIFKRTNTVNFENNDINTWTVDVIADKIIKEYDAALSNQAELEKIPVKNLKELIIEGSTQRDLRPTLYDFIAHKAFDMFSNNELSVSKPVDYFVVKEAYYFADAKSFAKQKIFSNDTLSLKYKAVVIVQKLLRSKLQKSNNTNLIIELELKRLKFAFKKSINSNKNSKYIKALDKLEAKYKNNPYSAEISYARAKYYKDIGSYRDYEKETTLKYKYNNKKTLEICNYIINKFPNQNKAEFAKKIKHEILSKRLSSNLENAIPVNAKYSTKIKYKNISKVWLKVVKISKTDYDSIVSRNSQFYYKKFAKYDELIKKSKEIYSISKELPVDSDYNTHSAEIIMPKIEEPGLYIILASDNKEFSYDNNLTSYNDFTVTNITYVKQTQPDNSIKFIVLNRQTGKPMPNVTCKIWYQKYHYKTRKYFRTDIATHTSDKNGEFIVKYVKGERTYQGYSCDFSMGNDFFSNSSHYSRGSLYLRPAPNVINETFITRLFTDRAIYRPGQKIYFKGITIKKTSGINKVEALKNIETKVTLYDANNQQVESLNLETNEYGTFSGSYTIPTGLINGRFKIQCSHGIKYISVEEYKRPKFEVKMLPFEGNYVINDSVKISGKAITFSGANLSEAIVKYNITRTPRWSGWWYHYIPSKSVQVASGTVDTDDSGLFNIKFMAIPDLSIKKSEYVSFNYAISASITDINGETQTVSSRINVGYNALKVSLDIDNLINKNSPKYKSKKTRLVKIKTVNYNNIHVDAIGSIKIYKLKDFPFPFRENRFNRSDKHLYSKTLLSDKNRNY